MLSAFRIISRCYRLVNSFSNPVCRGTVSIISPPSARPSFARTFSDVAVRDDILDEFFSASVSSSSVSPSKGEAPKRIKGELPPLDSEDLIKFDALLRCLKDGTEFRSSSFLVKAAYFARRADARRKKEFLDNIDEWWKRARVRQGLVVPNVLFHTVRLNAGSGGVVLKNLGGERFVNQLLGRWLDVGLDRFSIQEVSVGLAALGMLAFVDSAGKAIVDAAKLTRWDEFVGAFDRYCVEKTKEATASELVWLESSDGAAKLLQSVRLSTVIPSESTLKCLNDWALRSFKAYKDRAAAPASPTTLIGRTLRTYADAWLYWRINPDYLIPNSLSVWYDAFSTYLTDRKKGEVPSLYTLHLAPSIAAHFDRFSDFVRLYDQWHDAVSENLRARLNFRIRYDGHGHMPNLLFSLGGLVTAVKEVPVEIRGKLSSLTDDIMGEFCALDPANVSDRTLMEALSGYRKVKLATEDGALSPENVCSFLRRWCVHRRQNDHFRPQVSKYAASVIFALARGGSNTPRSLLDELSKLYFWGLSHAATDLVASLRCYSAACCMLSYDPADVGQHAWPTWFRNVRRCIEDYGVIGWTRKETEGYPKLLCVVLEVTWIFRRVDEFRSLQSIWERAAIDQLPRLNQSRLKRVDAGIKKLREEHDFRFDSRINDFLDKCKVRE